jgi:hypothetical protein
LKSVKRASADVSKDDAKSRNHKTPARGGRGFHLAFAINPDVEFLCLPAQRRILE